MIALNEAREARADTDIVIVGGCGHVGLALALAFADRGARVVAYDLDDAAVKTVMDGQLPFREDGAGEVLRRTLANGLFTVTSDITSVRSAEYVVMVVGTPIDEHLNPDPHAVTRAVDAVTPHLRRGQLLVLRSTVYPGVTSRVEKLLADRGITMDVAFCPERIAEGKAMTELFELPQIVAARTQDVRDRAGKLFSRLSPAIVELQPEEAELAKLITNTWRYIKFAVANQFYEMANDHGLDYNRIREAVVYDYPRAADLPSAGFAAGPCLLKDTMQLATFNDNAFSLGHAAMMVNEGLPLYMVSRLEAQYPLADLTVGILGTAFKGGSDDTRSSLAYKLKHILQFRAGGVLSTDPYVMTDPALLPLDYVLERSDILIIAAPHREYADLAIDKRIVDVWNLRGEGSGI